MGLPEEKKEKLAEKIADSIAPDLVRHVRELQKHEVSKMDAGDIVGRGMRKAAHQADKALNEEEPRK